MGVSSESRLQDPHLHLEDVLGDQALTWVRQENSRSLRELEADPRFARHRSEATELLEAQDRVPRGQIRSDRVTAFWQDQKHVRGILRETTLAEFKKPHSQWEILLDVDELAKNEDKNFVYRGSICYFRNPRKCMIVLSDGGKDASTSREFDLDKKQFVENGFSVPEAKAFYDWLDEDHLIVGTDWGPNTLSVSGYPRILKCWKRGTPLASAQTLYEADPTDMYAWPVVIHTPDESLVLINQHLSFYESRYHFWDRHLNEVVPLPVPLSASLVGLHEGQLVFSTNKDWQFDANTKIEKGSLFSFPLNEWRKTGELKNPQVIFAPHDRQSVQNIGISKGRVYICFLEDVRAKVISAKFDHGKWQVAPIALPDHGSIVFDSVSPLSDVSMMTYNGFLNPDQLFLVDDNGKVEMIKSISPKFKSDNLQVRQLFATSKDGERVPYFVVEPKDTPPGTPLPTLLYGYGGFEISMTPAYRPLIGKLWLEEGARFVLANIRGGGEYGPRWHQAALKENRQKAYDDFIAVAEDLIDNGLTTPEQLGIMGGSNGGLLMGVMFTQRPDLFKAVVCQVPLLDMIRYHKLLAGASWVAEYGDPDNSKEREVLLRYSPYHNLSPEKRYPSIFFVTSTKDDRVHPGHARKMAARLKDMGIPFFYYENIDGGHGTAANLKEWAYLAALEYTYLHRMLFNA